MTALFVSGAFALSLFTGFVLARLFLKNEKNGWWLLFISPAVGFGVTALVTFFSFYATGAIYFVPCLLFHAAIAAVAARFCRFKEMEFPHAPVFSSVLTVSAAFLTWKLFQSPYGAGLDAWAIWKLKARFIFYDANAWTHLFSEPLDFSCRDYPLFYPLMLVWGWSAAGGETLWAVWGLAAVFTLSIVGLFMALALEKGARAALFAGLFLVATPQFIGMGASQYADIFVSYFFLAGAALVWKSVDARGVFKGYLAGFVLGMGAFVKNEGLLFLLAVVAALMIFRYFRVAFAVKVGSLPALGVTAFFKARAGVTNDSVSWHNIEQAFRFGGIPAKLISVAQAFFSQVMNENLWVYAWFVIAAVVMCKLPGVFRRRGWHFAALIFMALGYAGVYILSPLELDRNLATSMDRLMLQMFPVSAYLALLLI